MKAMLEEEMAGASKAEKPPRMELPARLPAWPPDREAIWQEHDGVCGICGEPVSLEECEIDHIIPRSKGGGNERVNLQPAHSKCNRSKGNKLWPSVSPRFTHKNGGN
jgi:5-methylcytosine-specific restriction endonuclease McrA